MISHFSIFPSAAPVAVQVGNIDQFSKVAPYLQDPLVLIGFFLFLGFLFTRTLLKKGIIPTLPPTAGFKILKTILLYGFVIGLLLIALGFTFKYAELRAKERQATSELRSREAQAKLDRELKEKMDQELRQQDIARQRNTVALLRVELQNNLRLADELRKNTIVFLSGFKALSQVVRTPGIQLLTVLFPPENIDLKVTDAEASGLGDKAYDELGESGIYKDQLELRKFTAAANAIVTSINIQMSTIEKLQDSDHKRYVFRSEVWEANLPILRNVVVGNVPAFEESYSELTLLRNNYDVVTQHYVEYLVTLKEFFDPQKHTVNRAGVRAVLAKERQALVLMNTFSKSLADRMQALKSLDKTLAATVNTQLSKPAESQTSTSPSQQATVSP